jgi:type II secretion system protein I
MNKTTIKHLETLSTAGFTLLETSIAMVVMMIAVLGALSVFAYCVRNNSAANDRELAMAVAQQKLEQLRSVSFTDSSLDATPTSGTSTTITRAGRQYSVLTNIVHSNTVNGYPTVKTVTVKVTPKGTALGAVILSTLRATTVVGPNR